MPFITNSMMLYLVQACSSILEDMHLSRKLCQVEITESISTNAPRPYNDDRRGPEIFLGSTTVHAVPTCTVLDCKY